MVIGLVSLTLVRCDLSVLRVPSRNLAIYILLIYVIIILVIKFSLFIFFQTPLGEKVSIYSYSCSI